MEVNDVVKRHTDWVKSVGWWNSTTVLEDLALISSEIGEAVNECRGNKPTKNFGKELADIVLRVCTVCGKNNINLNEELDKKIKLNYKKGNKGRVK